MDITFTQELTRRWKAIQDYLKHTHPDLQGIFVFSRLNIYYLTGSLANGLLWLGVDAKEPVLMLRKGWDRAIQETPLQHIHKFKSYSDIPKILQEVGEPLLHDAPVGAEMNFLPWSLANLLKSRMPNVSFQPIDSAITHIRTRKSEYELGFMREAGKRHAMLLEETLPKILAQQNKKLTENEIAHLCINLYLEHGHGGLLRMNAFGEEVFFGHIAVGNSGNQSHYYNGPMGFQGIHPALPCLGSDLIWDNGMPLCIDFAFNYNAYITDKTQTYFMGKKLPDMAKNAYDCCHEIHSYAADALRTGSIPSQIWEESKKIAMRAGFAESFMGLGSDPVAFLGHGIGLCIDEQPVIATGFDLPLEAGMTIAIEPKIGIEGFGMMGIENTFEVTDTGGICLTTVDSSSKKFPVIFIN